MITVNLAQILKQNNKTVYWLSKETGISQNGLGRIAKNQTTSINFDTLAKICRALNCEISDILILNK